MLSSVLERHGDDEETLFDSKLGLCMCLGKIAQCETDEELEFGDQTRRSDEQSHT